jgi:hypothetical protein
VSSGQGTLKMLNRDIREIGEALGNFSTSAQIFSSDNPRMIDLYENKWVGVYNGRIEAVADTLDKLLEQVEDKNIPAGNTVVRFINREPKTLIL